MPPTHVSSAEAQEAVDSAAPPPRYKAAVVRVVRDTALTREMKRECGHRCHVCGEAIPLGRGESYSEGHHLRPLGSKHAGPDVRSNILILCPNHHAQFDLRGLAIRPQTGRLVSGGPERSVPLQGVSQCPAPTSTESVSGTHGRTSFWVRRRAPRGRQGYSAPESPPPDRVNAASRFQTGPAARCCWTAGAACGSRRPATLPGTTTSGVSTSRAAPCSVRMTAATSSAWTWTRGRRSGSTREGAAAVTRGRAGQPRTPGLERERTQREGTGDASPAASQAKRAVTQWEMAFSPEGKCAQRQRMRCLDPCLLAQGRRLGPGLRGESGRFTRPLLESPGAAGVACDMR